MHYASRKKKERNKGNIKRPRPVQEALEGALKGKRCSSDYIVRFAQNT